MAGSVFYLMDSILSQIYDIKMMSTHFSIGPFFLTEKVQRKSLTVVDPNTHLVAFFVGIRCPCSWWGNARIVVVCCGTKSRPWHTTHPTRHTDGEPVIRTCISVCGYAASEGSCPVARRGPCLEIGAHFTMKQLSGV
jgi:hypothetical protein